MGSLRLTGEDAVAQRFWKRELGSNISEAKYHLNQETSDFAVCVFTLLCEFAGRQGTGKASRDELGDKPVVLRCASPEEQSQAGPSITVPRASHIGHWGVPNGHLRAISGKTDFFA